MNHFKLTDAFMLQSSWMKLAGNDPMLSMYAMNWWLIHVNLKVSAEISIEKYVGRISTAVVNHLGYYSALMLHEID